MTDIKPSKEPIVAKGNGSALIAQCTLGILLIWIAVIWGIISIKTTTIADIPDRIETIVYTLFAALTAVSGIGKYFPKEK